MDRKATAKETLRIMEQGYYEYQGEKISIMEDHRASVKKSILITPEEGENLLKKYKSGERKRKGVLYMTVENNSTVDAVIELVEEGKNSIGVLNFASAKNPGGGFLNGAMAQEESLAASSGLYKTLTVHEEYYRANRNFGSVMYTDHGIYSPNVVFFRDGGFNLLKEPVKASVLTLPAVNMGQVLQKGEDQQEAKRIMKRRMAIALAVFAEQGDRNLVLGAYGCGVFRNDPKEVALWWKELLEGGFDGYFERILFAVLDRSKTQSCIRSFEELFGE
ncbi:TIGR02452 family protein [Clostridium sp. chh4-2]|uniref:TIGR02452 family protein n=1 Tax=Clostridium sp. chh4-2 TaxID=2067550 RepID=UPI000CCE9E17|nr:TIGR02452 family protein [Clostridium sp. chh4-2]PNV64015.1 TIGR02452 family protein [Clostridium sp. chh4-2]